jgi:hypothetical protein
MGRALPRRVDGERWERILAGRTVKWQAKVAAQAILAHLPGGESLNHRLQRAQGRHTP